VHPRIKKSALGLWLSTFALLALVIAGVFWALERGTDTAAMAPLPRNSAVPVSSGGQLPLANDEPPVPEDQPTAADQDQESQPAAARRGSRNNRGRNNLPQANNPSFQELPPAAAPQTPAAEAPPAQAPAPQADLPAAVSGEVPSTPEPAPETAAPPGAVETPPGPLPEPERASEAPVPP
jgi:hypothetical protein